jgi:archaellum component FlaC
MQLKDLFEAIGDLLPGEKRVPPQIQLRNLEKVQRRINDLKDAIGKSDDLMALFKNDQELQNKLTTLQNRITRKVEMLYKVKARPTTGMDRMWHILETECSDFLPQMKQAGKLLYRGTKDDVSQYEGRSREARAPKDSNPEISRKLDEILLALGMKALRSNSIYTTSNYGFASSYGYNVYMIFPKNGFHFLSTNKKDLILEKWPQLMDYEELKNFWEELNEWGLVNKGDAWKNTGVGKAIRYKEWDYVYRLVKENFDWENNRLGMPDKYNVDPKDWVTPESVEKALEPNQTDLVSAMQSGREILINGEYWALEKRTWEAAVRHKYLSAHPEPDYY